MPKYTRDKVCGCYLYYTAACVIEAMHVHASNEQLREDASAKFFVRKDGSTLVAQRGCLKEWQISGIQRYIKLNYLDMYGTWSRISNKGFFNN